MTGHHTTAPDAPGGACGRSAGFVVATGSRPAVPPLPGLAGAPYLASENVVGLTELPASLAVLGGGPAQQRRAASGEGSRR